MKGNVESAAWVITFGLILNGCMSERPMNVSEYDIVDEMALVKGMVKSACYSSGRNWIDGDCVK